MNVTAGGDHISSGVEPVVSLFKDVGEVGVAPFSIIRVTVKGALLLIALERSLERIVSGFPQAIELCFVGKSYFKNCGLKQFRGGGIVHGIQNRVRNDKPDRIDIRDAVRVADRGVNFNKNTGARIVLIDLFASGSFVKYVWRSVQSERNLTRGNRSQEPSSAYRGQSSLSSTQV